MILQSPKVPGQDSSPCSPRHDIIGQKLHPNANTHSEKGVRLAPDAMAAGSFLTDYRWRNEAFPIRMFANPILRYPDCVKKVVTHSKV